MRKSRKMERRTCATCGAVSVAHTKNGQPHWEHTRTERHIIAAYNAKRAAKSAPEEGAPT